MWKSEHSGPHEVRLRKNVNLIQTGAWTRSASCFSSKYPLLTQIPNGGSFPFHEGTDCRNWKRRWAEERRQRRNGTAALQPAVRGHWETTAIFQGSHSLLQGYPRRAQAQKRRNKSESPSAGVRQLSRPGLCEACPQVQSYSNSGMSFS